MRNYIYAAFALILINGALPAFADTSTATVPSGTTTVPVSGGFDTAPKDVKGVVKSMSPSGQRFILVKPDKQEMEIAVSTSTEMKTLTGMTMHAGDLTGGTTIQVRYDPLTLRAMKIQQTR